METKPTYHFKQPSETILHTSNTPKDFNRKTRKHTKKKNKIDKKKVKKRCALDGCRKKLRLTDCACRCQHIYCQKHRLPEAHACSVDYKKFDRDSFIKKAGLIDCNPTKLQMI